jgi:enamine deaminase RidA (YjgF/YER057c/UK114 family)
MLYNNTAYISNIVASDLSMNIVEETKSILRIIDTKLEKINSSKNSILRCIIYYRNVDDYITIHDIFKLWKPKDLDIEYLGNIYINPVNNIMASLITTTHKLFNYINNNINYVI